MRIARLARISRIATAVALPLVTAAPILAQSTAQKRAAKVRNDRQAMLADKTWIYNDMSKGLAEARKTGKPLLVVIRCIP